jgi:uncharacterized membrane protein
MSDAALPSESGTRAIVLIAYGLFLLAVFNGVTAIAGVILLYVKRAAAHGTAWDSHVRHLILVFWISVAAGLLLLAVMLPAAGSLLFSLFATDGHPSPVLIGWLLAVLPAIYIGCGVFAIWYLYATVRGLIYALDGKPY